MDDTNRQGVIVLISLGFAPPPAPPPKPCSLFRGPKDAASRRHGVSPAPRRTPFRSRGLRGLCGQGPLQRPPGDPERDIGR